MAVHQRELDLHFFAQAVAHPGTRCLERGDLFGGHILQRLAALVRDDELRFAFRQRRAPLRLRQPAARHLCLTGFGRGELHHARPRQALPDAQCHFLHHKAQTRIRRRALRLPEQPRGRPFPGARHGFQHLGQLFAGVLRERLVHLGLEGRLGQPGRDRPFEPVGIQPQHIDRIGADEADIKRIGRRLAMRLRQFRRLGIVHPDVQDRPRPTPIRHLRGGADRQQRPLAEHVEQRADIGHAPARDGAHRVEPQRDRARHRQVEPHQPLQAFRAIAMGRGADLGRGRDRGEIGRAQHAGLVCICSNRYNRCANCPEKWTGDAVTAAPCPTASTLDPRQVGHRAAGLHDPVEQVQAVAPHHLVLGIDLYGGKKGVDGRAQGGHMGHRAREIL